MDQVNRNDMKMREEGEERENDNNNVSVSAKITKHMEKL